MPVTPNGTAYTVYTATIPGLGRVRYIIADDALRDSNVPTVLYAHGANGSVGSFSGGAGTADLRNWLMDRRWALIEGEGGTPDSSGVTFNHWGNSMNRAAYRAYLDFVGSVIDIGPLFVCGASMGGLITKWLATRSDIAGDIRGLISFAGVGTLFVGDDDPVPANVPPNITQKSVRYFSSATGVAAAYGATSYEELVVAAADHAPENWNPSVWSGKRILELYAENDIAVPWSPRGSSALRAIRAGLPELDLAENHGVLTTGPAGTGHDLAGGYGMHLSAVTDFLTSSLPTGPEPEMFFLSKYWYMVAPDGKLVPVRQHS